ncbi:carboxylesterase [Bipolaris maydis]|nr:carboxylesterase [Bipolaris maydis]
MSPSPIVTIASGVVIGTTTKPANQPGLPASANICLGVPFAKSPPERFSRPEAVQPCSSPLQANTLKPACIQQFSGKNRAKVTEFFNNPLHEPPEESEDCLYVNVYTPAGVNSTSKKAVMFWIFGGNLAFGTGGLNYYDGSSLTINEDVVVVTINYRTNIFGFSNSPEIPSGCQNSGFLDQRFAIQWVQDNIASFGGDPKQTLPVCAPFPPVNGDGTSIDDSRPSIRSKKWAQVPTMFGTNLNEAPIFLAVIGSNDATAAFNSIVEQVNTSSTDAPDAHTAVTDTYAKQGITVFDKLLDRVLTDAVYTCTTARLSNFLDRNSYTTYRYMYSGVFPSASIFKDAGAYHTSEVPQVFGTWERSNRSGNATEQQIKLSSFMQKTWANFAKDSEKGVGWAKAGTSTNSPVMERYTMPTNRSSNGDNP